jgi:6-phosphofructokinase 1
MVGIKRLDKSNYQVEYIPVDVYKVANKEQVIPRHMIDGNNVTKAFYDYIYPLIEGEFQQIYKNGVQQFFKL